MARLVLKVVRSRLIKLFLGLAFISPLGQVHAQDFLFTGKVETLAPIGISVGGEVLISEVVSVYGGLGYVPKPYVDLIGQVSAEFGGNDAYDDVIRAALATNSFFNFGIDYHLTGKQGWSAGLLFQIIKAEGEGPVDQVLEAATGEDFSTLKNALALAGRDSDIALSGTLFIAGVLGKYTSYFSEGWSWTGTLGIGKVLSAAVEMDTGLPLFEATVVGAQLISDGESDLEDILVSNGVSPLVGASINYSF